MRCNKILSILAALTISTMSMAGDVDSYQFYESDTEYYLSFWYMHIGGELVGTTDKFGRIAIDLAPGEYIAVLTQESDIGIVSIIADDVMTVKKVKVVIVDASELADSLNNKYNAPFLTENSEYNMFKYSVESFNQQVAQMPLENIYDSQEEQEKLLSDLNDNFNLFLFSEGQEEEMIKEYLEKLTEK